MRVFFSDLKGKTVMTDEGDLLGTLEDFIANTHNGHLVSMLIKAAETVEPRLFTRDTKGRILLPFKSFRTVRDVIVVARLESE